ncbi:MAG: phytoene synthase, partial [Xanthomonadales bacterium]|nr:phytoene synthase [Xanthomonadales bacterium]
MSDPALTSIVDAWLRARPEWALAMPYLHGGEHAALIALACLEQQWIESVYGIGETDVAVAKLSWWRQELDAARGGAAQHPLTKALFADERVLAI